MVLCEHILFLKKGLLQGPDCILLPNTRTRTHIHRHTYRPAHADTKNRFIQTNNCFPTMTEKHPYSPERWDCWESLCFQSWRFIHPTTNNGHLTSRSYWTSLFCLPPISQFSLFLRAVPISSWAILGWESFTGGCCTASTIVNNRLELGHSAGLLSTQCQVSLWNTHEIESID